MTMLASGPPRIWMEMSWSSLGRNTWTAGQLQYLLELETKIAEDYAKFYNHEEGLY